MAEVLRPTNFDSINIVETSELSADVAAAQKVANVLSVLGFAVDDFFVIGELSAELAEVGKVASKSGNAITAVANYGQAHKKGDAVTKLFGDKIRIYRAANADGSAPADGSFSLLSTFDIEADQNYTEYTDTSGGSDYWYKKVYYNSVSTSETNLADAPAVRGGNYGMYATWEEVRDEAGLTNNRHIDAGVYQDKLEMAQDEANASLRIGGYTLPLTSIPKIVKNATILIAAGYVLLRDYGPENSGTNKEGNQKLTEGRKLLTKIEEGGEITDSSGTPIDTDTNARINGYPDDTAAYNTPSEDRFFKTTDKF